MHYYVDMDIQDSRLCEFPPGYHANMFLELAGAISNSKVYSSEEDEPYAVT